MTAATKSVKRVTKRQMGKADSSSVGGPLKSARESRGLNAPEQSQPGSAAVPRPSQNKRAKSSMLKCAVYSHIRRSVWGFARGFKLSDAPFTN